MWRVIWYGGFAVIAVCVEGLYVVFWPVAWYPLFIVLAVGFFFGWLAWQAWRLRQAGRAELVQYMRRNTVLALLVVLSAACLLAVPVSAMTCTTHTYSVDGRYVMCQTCCTNGMCQTTCF